MRYVSKKQRRGETRVIVKFLFLPKKIGNEWRWLERAAIEQRCDWSDGFLWVVFSYKHYGWADVKWVNEERI